MKKRRTEYSGKFFVLRNFHFDEYGEIHYTIFEIDGKMVADTIGEWFSRKPLYGEEVGGWCSKESCAIKSASDIYIDPRCRFRIHTSGLCCDDRDLQRDIENRIEELKDATQAGLVKERKILEQQLQTHFFPNSVNFINDLAAEQKSDSDSSDDES